MQLRWFGILHFHSKKKKKNYWSFSYWYFAFRKKKKKKRKHIQFKIQLKTFKHWDKNLANKNRPNPFLNNTLKLMLLKLYGGKFEVDAPEKSDLLIATSINIHIVFGYI